MDWTTITKSSIPRYTLPTNSWTLFSIVGILSTPYNISINIDVIISSKRDPKYIANSLDRDDIIFDSKTKELIFDDKTKELIFDDKTKELIFDDKTKKIVFDSKTKSLIFDSLKTK